MVWLQIGNYQIKIWKNIYSREKLKQKNIWEVATVTGFEAHAEGDRKEQKIAEIGHLYNIYDEPEYTFTTFENGGYKICHEKSGETIVL